MDTTPDVDRMISVIVISKVRSDLKNALAAIDEGLSSMGILGQKYLLLSLLEAEINEILTNYCTP